MSFGLVTHWRMLLGMFRPRERLQIYLLLVSTAVLGLVEVAGVASIMPFIAVVIDPATIDSNPYLHALYERLGFANHRSLQVFLGALALGLLVVTNLLAACHAWFVFRFCYLRSNELCTRLMARYLALPYETFLVRSTAEMQKIVVTDVDRVVIGTLMAGVHVFAHIVSAAFILLVLLFMDPWVTLTTFAVLAVGYGAIFLLIQRKVAALGEEWVRLETEIVQRTREALEGAREIKVLHKEPDFVRRFATPHLRSALNAIRHQTLDIIPRYLLETTAFGLIIGITLYYIATARASTETLAVIALYAYAAYRLVPSLKGIVDGIDTVRYNAAALEVVAQDLSAKSEPAAPAARVATRPLQRAIQLNDVRFTYPGAQRPAVQGLTLRIEARTLTCIMGHTGAGKSTAIDLVLGLLRPESGRILLDDETLDAQNVMQWQASIGYVAQSIYVIDDTVMRNIAFGVPDADIDRERVRAAARAADIDEFIVNDLEKGYDTVLGEKGVRLSGGQRQRIGIARAVYRDPAVLILDEATNALDLETERRVLVRLGALEPKRTIVCVSHKESVARYADRIIVIAHGQVSAEGTYEELTRSETRLRSLIVGA